MINYDVSGLLIFENQKLSVKETTFQDSYLAAAIADFLRYKMIQSDSSFSYETVFSHISKLKELEIAKKAGFKIYLYFIGTENPLINVQRIINRVETGGHSVPDEKIISRYSRTMNNLFEALKISDKAYIFDNSSERLNGSFDFFLEKESDVLNIKENNNIPQWFDEYVLRKI